MVAPSARVKRLLLAVIVVLALAAGVLAIRQRGGFGGAAPSPADIFPHGALRVGIDPSYPPFAVAHDGGLAGFDVDIAREAARRIGVPVRFVPLGYDGLYDALKTDQVDVLISALRIDPARRDDVLYTTPYYNAGLVLVSDERQALTSMADMSGRALAYEFGSAADSEARKWLRRVLPFETRPYEMAEFALDAVRLGRADAALVDATTARLYLRDYSAWPGRYSHVTDQWYAAATRIDRRQAWAAINSAIESMIADGSIAVIAQRWL